MEPVKKTEKTPGTLIMELMYGAVYTTAIALIISSIYVFLSTELSSEFTFCILVIGAICSFLSSHAITLKEETKDGHSQKFFLISSLIQIILGCVSLIV